MLDVAVSYNRYKFLGHEFLTWLWYLIDTQPGTIKNADGEAVLLEIGNRIVLENKLRDNMETVTITGDDAGLEEGMLALKKGALVSEINLLHQEKEHEWRFTVKGESLGLSNLRCPQTAPAESEEDTEGALLERVFLYEKITALIDNLYKQFISLRISLDWTKKVVPEMRTWVEKH